MSILAELETGIRTACADETMEVARRLAAELPADAVVTLSGDLGAGKTTFVKGLAAAWGITQTVTSPTYNIFTLYQGRDRQLAHMDAYRLEGADAVDGLMLEEFLRSPFCLVIEWPEKIADWIPFDAVRLEFKSGTGNERQIRKKAEG
jgi:tRNA threonylcarbamoyladenosine biosynthesis protein TsaE